MKTKTIIWAIAVLSFVLLPVIAAFAGEEPVTTLTIPVKGKWLFGLSTFEFGFAISFLTGAIFWAGGMYQKLKDGVDELKEMRTGYLHLNGRVKRIEKHLDIDAPPIVKLHNPKGN